MSLFLVVISMLYPIIVTYLHCTIKDMFVKFQNIGTRGGYRYGKMVMIRKFAGVAWVKDGLIMVVGNYGSRNLELEYCDFMLC